ncbi:pyridoxal-phosphate dependent enzyme [Nakamurella sp. YIM 132087]|uniref:Pyridoxal-phosphate dependent enzyme n=1 Tax=Nakamurella alba TaxID=2665158 RepID=A0A7K1FR53_9ACTN|nr:pyridoxal-phosphate dependent enzyme [Nakamurella alba]MTD16632.1 pyridoxal-phosphate dependent enzyme [Nakamurella alba]
MTRYGSVLDTIGRTPLIRLRRVTEGIDAEVYLKAEQFNPGTSVKDRTALWLVDDAVRSGALGPGGTIVEATSGNTGIGLAQVAAARGYRLVAVISDRISVEKRLTLLAYGAEVVFGTAGVPREDPTSVHSTAVRLAAEIPGAWRADQYDNPANPRAHRERTGPEIWDDTEGRVTHFVAGIGTGGTITGAGGYLREVSGGTVTVIGADPVSSSYGGGDGSPFLVEASGHYRHPDTAEDVWPLSYDTGVVDRIERIGDRQSVLTVRDLARREGILVGGSTGLAVAAALRVARDLPRDAVVVALGPDSGRAYLSKYHSDDWLRTNGFLEDGTGPLVCDAAPADAATFPALDHTSTVGEALLWLADRTGPAAVRLARPTDDLAPALAEILGTVRAEQLLLLPDRSVTLDAVLDQVPPALGVGESAATAVRRLRELGQDHGLVVRDGRFAGLVTVEGLLRAGSAVPVPHRPVAALHLS